MSTDKAIDRILELSAEAQTKRREAAENSPTFHKLTGAVLAYGEALNLLTKLQSGRGERSLRETLAIDEIDWASCSLRFGQGNPKTC